MDRYRKYVDYGLGLAALLLWYFLHQLLTQVWDVLRFPVGGNLPVALPDLLAIVLAALAFIFVRRNAKSYAFLNEVAMELSKVSWPTLQETAASTGVIIVMVAIASGFMGFFDFLWGTATASLLRL